MTVRDVKPFVGDLTVPYFMDSKLIQQTMIERGLERQAAIRFLQNKWMKEESHGHS